MMSTAVPLPSTIREYLEQLRQCLGSADPALIQDALYDAEEYLRAELAENSDKSEAEIIAAVATSYGIPDEVADIYRTNEVTVQTALRTPPARPRSPESSFLAGFFGVAADPRTYAALFYMLFSLVTGVIYFSWAVTGIALSAGLAVLIIGIPFVIVFVGSVRVLSLVEGRLIEVLLGVRMPRRPQYQERGQPWLTRIKLMFSDLRTWTTLLYMVLMLPIGVSYFTIAVTLLSCSIAFILSPLLVWLGYATSRLQVDGFQLLNFGSGELTTSFAPALLPLVLIAGFVLLFATLHLARAIGKVHGLLAKHLLVQSTTSH